MAKKTGIITIFVDKKRMIDRIVPALFKMGLFKINGGWDIMNSSGELAGRFLEIEGPGFLVDILDHATDYRGADAMPVELTK